MSSDPLTEAARRMYEYRPPGDPGPHVPWEELTADGRDFYRGMARAGRSDLEPAAPAARSRTRPAALTDARGRIRSRCAEIERDMGLSPVEMARALSDVRGTYHARIAQDRRKAGHAGATS